MSSERNEFYLYHRSEDRRFALGTFSRFTFIPIYFSIGVISFGGTGVG